MPAKVFDKYLLLVGAAGWVCNDCREAARSLFARLNAAMNRLAEELASLREELTELSASRSANHQSPGSTTRLAQLQPQMVDPAADSETSGPVTIRQAALIVQRTVDDAMRRGSNIIVTGIPEGEGTGDLQQFLQLCEDNLQMKPLVTDNDCIRIGKKVPNRPRRLLVRLRSDETASSLLRRAPQLRKSTCKYIAENIYLNPDLSPAAAKVAFEARKARRERREGQQQHHSTATTNAEQNNNDLAGSNVIDTADGNTASLHPNRLDFLPVNNTDEHESFQ